MAERLRIALLTHSVNPRGGVVHVLELGRALLARGHAVTVIAPAARGQRFFRETPCRVELAELPPSASDLAETVSQRIEAMRRQLSALLQHERFDVFHAHDGIGGDTPAGQPVVLTVGGIEARKNTRRLLQAFVLLRQRLPRAQLVVAGGASLLDHGNEATAFHAEAAAAGLRIGPNQAIVITGALPDADMPALYRSAGVLAMPSLIEGFGLAALEALASGTPAVVSRMAPFTEHFAESDVDWADPLQPASIADALQRAVARGRHREALAVCRRFSWAASAARHEALYRVHEPA